MVVLGSILNLFVTQNGIGGTINFIACVGIALYCVNNFKPSGFLVVLICIYLMYFVYKAIFIDLIDTNLIFENIGLSRNYPGFMLVIFISYWGFVKYKCYQSYPFFLPVCALLLCFLLEGRASLGIMLGICVLTIYYHGKKYTLWFLLVIIVALLHYWQNILEFMSFTRFASAGMETSRSVIWKAYFDALDLPSLFFGLDTLSVPMLKSYGGNPHNAFLNFHSRMGLLGLLALAVLIIKSINAMLKNREYVLVFYLVLLLGRFYFDACIGGPTDYLFYTMLFYPMIRKKQYQVDNKMSVCKKPLFSNIYTKLIKLI